MSHKGLIYSFVAKGSVVLAEHTSFSGNFSTIAVQCLQKLPSSSTKYTYSCDGHTFNFLLDNGFVFLVVADESVGRGAPFVFLERVKADFMQHYGPNIKNEGPHLLADEDENDDLFEDRFSIAHNLGKEFGPKLKEHMQFCTEHPEEMSKLSKVKAPITEVKGVMMDNVEKARWQQEEKSKEELLEQASSIRKEREQLEALAKSKEDQIKLKAESNLQKYKDDIQNLNKEISQLRLKSDSSKIAALRRGVDGSYANRVTDVEKNLDKDSQRPYISEVSKDLHDYSETGGVKRDRECVMRLSEEMSVVFLPCAHQVVCRTCNELHEKQGMKDCPSCRSPIQWRISVRYARS